MTIELASTRAVEKPWGRTDLRPWSDAGRANGRVGEIWYERSDPAANEPSLLLKLLFTSEPLSVQVHPGDAFARSIGEARGKSEAWYILSATCDAKVAVGLKWRPTTQQLRSSIEPINFKEHVSDQVRKAEGIAFGLRTAIGISASEMTRWTSELDALRQEGYIQEENARIRLTAKGRMVADSIAELFV